MSKPFMQYDVADFSNTNIENKSLAEIRRDSYTEGFMKGKLEGRADAIDEFAKTLISYIVNEKAKGNEPYWTNAIRDVAERVKEQDNG